MVICIEFSNILVVSQMNLSKVPRKNDQHFMLGTIDQTDSCVPIVIAQPMLWEGRMTDDDPVWLCVAGILIQSLRLIVARTSPWRSFVLVVSL